MIAIKVLNLTTHQTEMNLIFPDHLPRVGDLLISTLKTYKIVKVKHIIKKSALSGQQGLDVYNQDSVEIDVIEEGEI